MNTLSARVHLVAGPIGAGKTTYADRLSERTGGIRFSIDEWMMSLYGPDVTEPLDPAWVFDRVKRCNEQILSVALPVAERGVDVFLDLGFTDLNGRAAAAKAAAAKNLAVKLHWLDASPAERWARVERRNLNGGGPAFLRITREMFEFMESRNQRPPENELQDLDAVVVQT